ncbi:MAG: putative toxin-antitoxin system toxin component, PIN family [Synergistaceae bacterium]|nr:putative toxin-antitoxin system toxin component, PIN family [Synergistaceae bacterium]
MKILVDTNVLISAMVFDGRIYDLLAHILKFRKRDIYVLVSEYVEHEFMSILNKKWPSRFCGLYHQFRTMDFVFCESAPNLTGMLRDPKDIPVLSDALYHDVDIILTGDKDFLESGITRPLIFSPARLADLLRL